MVVLQYGKSFPSPNDTVAFILSYMSVEKKFSYILYTKTISSLKFVNTKHVCWLWPNLQKIDIMTLFGNLDFCISEFHTPKVL